MKFGCKEKKESSVVNGSYNTKYRIEEKKRNKIH